MQSRNIGKEQNFLIRNIIKKKKYHFYLSDDTVLKKKYNAQCF